VSACPGILRVLGPELPTPLGELRPDVPSELNRICMKCLHKNPPDRFPDADALARELRSLRTRSQSLSGTHVALSRAALVLAQTGKGFVLKDGVNVVGRASDCEIALKSAGVSKRHCQIVVRDDQVTVEDLGSINGTLLNGEAIRRGVLNDGDVLEVGGHNFTIRLNRPSR
jgi:pSer/pThr/pTyr-binding forkhead associated (FHA) protein